MANWSDMFTGAREMKRIAEQLDEMNKAFAKLALPRLPKLPELPLQAVREAEAFKRSALAGIATSAGLADFRSFPSEQMSLARMMKSVRVDTEAMQILTQGVAEAGRATAVHCQSASTAQFASQCKAAFGLNTAALHDSISSLMRTGMDVEAWRFATKSAETLTSIFQQSAVARTDWERARVELRIFRRELLRYPHAVRSFLWKLPGACSKSPRELRELLRAVLDLLNPRQLFQKLRIRVSRESAILRLDLGPGTPIRRDNRPRLPLRDVFLDRQHGRRAPPLGLGMNGQFISGQADLRSI